MIYIVLLNIPFSKFLYHDNTHVIVDIIAMNFIF